MRFSVSGSGTRPAARQFVPDAETRFRAGPPRRAARGKVQTFPVTCSRVSVCAWVAIDSDSGLHGAHCASPRDGKESREIRSAR